MGALPSREFQENPENVYFAQVGETRATFIPLTHHFFPSPSCLAFRQFFDARFNQSAKYYYVPLSDTPAERDARRDPVEDVRVGERTDEKQGTADETDSPIQDRAELVAKIPPSSSYMLDHEPRLIPFLAREGRPHTLHAVHPRRVEGAPMDAVLITSHKPLVSQYEAVADINEENYHRFFSGIRDRCVEDETADIVTMPRYGMAKAASSSPAEAAKTSVSSSSSSLLVSADEPRKSPSSHAGLQSDISVAYDRYDHNREYYYYGTPEALYRIVVTSQAHHVLATNKEMCDQYAQEGAWLAGRRRVRQARRRAQSRARRQGTAKGSVSSPAADTPSLADLPPPPREFIRPISEAAVVTLTIEDEAHAVAEHLGLFVEEAMSRVAARALRPATSAAASPSRTAPSPRTRYHFESDASYKDGRLHLVEEDGVLYLFAYRTPGGTVDEIDLDCVDAFAVPIQAVRIFAANCLIESWCRATPWTRGLDDDPEEDAYIEFEMPVKPPVMRPAWFVDARVSGERLFAQLSCMETVLYPRLCRAAGLPGTLVRPGWEKDPLFGLPMLQTTRKLSAYVVTRLREAASSGELAARSLADIKAALASSRVAGESGQLSIPNTPPAAAPTQEEKDRIDTEVIEALMKLADLDETVSLLEPDADTDEDDAENALLDAQVDNAVVAAEAEKARQRALTLNAVRELIHQCDVHKLEIDGISASAFRSLTESGALPQRNSRYRSAFSVRGNYGVVRARVEGLLFFFKIYDILGFDDTLLAEALAADDVQSREAIQHVYPGAPPASDTPPENYSEQLYDYGGTVRVHCLRAPPITRPMRPVDVALLASPSDASARGKDDDGLVAIAHGVPTDAQPLDETCAGAHVSSEVWHAALPHVASFVRPREEAQVLAPPSPQVLDDIRQNAVRQERQWRSWRRYLTRRSRLTPLSTRASAETRSAEASGGPTQSVDATELVPVIVFVAVNSSRLAEGPSSAHGAYVDSLVKAMEAEEAAKAAAVKSSALKQVDEDDDGATNANRASHAGRDASEDDEEEDSVGAWPPVPPHRYMYPAHYVLDSQLLVYNILAGQWEHLAVTLRRNALRYARVLREVAAMTTAAAEVDVRAEADDEAANSAQSKLSASMACLQPLEAVQKDEVGLAEVLVCWIKRVQRQIPLTNRHDPGWLRDPSTGRIVQQGRYYMYSFVKAGERFYCGAVPHFATDRRKMKKKMLREAAAAAAAAAATTNTSVTTAAATDATPATHVDDSTSSQGNASALSPPSVRSSPPFAPPRRTSMGPKAHSDEVLTAVSNTSALNLACVLGSGSVDALISSGAGGCTVVFPSPENATDATRAAITEAQSISSLLGTSQGESQPRRERRRTGERVGRDAFGHSEPSYKPLMDRAVEGSGAAGAGCHLYEQPRHHQLPPHHSHRRGPTGTSRSPTSQQPPVVASSWGHHPTHTRFAASRFADPPPPPYGPAPHQPPHYASVASHVPLSYTSPTQPRPESCAFSDAGAPAAMYSAPCVLSPQHPNVPSPPFVRVTTHPHVPAPARRHLVETITVPLSGLHPLEESGLAASSPMRNDTRTAAPAPLEERTATAQAHTTPARANVSSQRSLGTSGRYVWNPYSDISR